MEKRGGILPEGDSLQRAVRWLASQRMEGDKTPRDKLIDEAALRFDLTPMEAEFLWNNFEAREVSRPR